LTLGNPDDASSIAGHETHLDVVRENRARRSTVNGLLVRARALARLRGSEEKRAVGAVWASRSGGRCLFVMPTDGDFSAIARAIKS